MTTIETERLLLRPFRTDDWRNLQRVVTGYMNGPFGRFDHQWPTTGEGIRDAITWFASGDAYLAVCRRADDRFLGLVCLNPGPDADSRDLGYIFDAEIHGNGYAFEACRALIDRAFRKDGVERIVTGTAQVNERSVNLLRKLGMEITGEGTGSFCTDDDGNPIEFAGYTFELTRPDWMAHRAQCTSQDHPCVVSGRDYHSHQNKTLRSSAKACGLDTVPEGI